MTARKPISFIATSDPDAAEIFYTSFMALTLVERSPFALAYLDDGQMLRVQIVEGFSPAPHTAHGWEVSNIVTEMNRLAALGVIFLQVPLLEQDPAGVWTTPDGHQIAWFKDPSGNTLSLTQFAN